MDYNDIRDLLNKYWAGETDLSEEKCLRDFFSEARPLPDDLKKESALFVFFGHESSHAALAGDLTQKLRNRWAITQDVPVKKMMSRRRLLTYAAALVPLLLLGYFFVHRNKNEQTVTVQTGTLANSQQAMAETENTLLLLSKNLNDGLATLEAFKLFDDVKNSEKLNPERPRNHKIRR